MPTVQLEYLTRGVGQLVVKVMHEGGDRARGVEDTQAVLGKDLGAAFGCDGAGHRGREKAGENGIGADAVAAVAPRQIMGQT